MSIFKAIGGIATAAVSIGVTVAHTVAQAPGAAVNAVSQTPKFAGAAINKGVATQANVFNVIYQDGARIAGSAGTAGSTLYDIATFPAALDNQMIASTGEIVAGTVNGKSPADALAAPLAAAIHEARSRNYQNSQPIPDDVKAALRSYFDSEVLERARYAIGNVQITLPGLIGGVNKLMGNDAYAITVDDIIVFYQDPGSFAHSPGWWAHEMTHVRQYRDLGVEQFAYDYVRSAGHLLEDPAVAMGNRVVNDLSQAGTAPAESDSAPTLAKYRYQGGAEHTFTRQDGKYVLTEPAGTSSFEIVGRDTVDGNSGTVLRRDTWYVFLPDTHANGSNPDWLRQRNAGETDWRWYQQETAAQ